MVFGKKKKNNIVEEYFLYIDNNIWKTFFDNECLSQYKNLLSLITNSHSDDNKWTEAITKLRKEWKNKTHNYIVPRPKRDHKSQKRIQCAINNKEFYEYFIPTFQRSDIFERHN